MIKMRTREKRYKDYGVTKEEKEKVLNFCKNAKKEDEFLIRNAALCANPYIADYICDSLKNDLSYDRLFKTLYVPIGRDDFYGYRRKTIAILKNLLLLSGMWGQIEK